MPLVTALRETPPRGTGCLPAGKDGRLAACSKNHKRPNPLPRRTFPRVPLSGLCPAFVTTSDRAHRINPGQYAAWRIVRTDLAFSAREPKNGLGVRTARRRTSGGDHPWHRGTTMNPYSTLCDDFGVYVYLNTKMELPSGRETVLHFFDSLQKTFPQMTDFDCRESGEYVL